MSAQIVAEAREWLGTKLVFGQSVKQIGCDCKGLVAGVARACGRAEGDSVQALAQDYRAVDPRRLKAGLRALFDPATTIEAGDVLLLKTGGAAQHLAIATGEGTLIHCSARVSPRRVVEQALAETMPIFPLDSVWRWRSVEA
jgi:NlpC/P60 family putative phage cell wall peptidase